MCTMTGRAYDPAEFEHLRVDDDIKDLFDCILHYKPEIRDIETKLEPFIPDYIPAVGDIDAMIKIPRHDRVDLELGLEIVDEPCAAQSDPTVLDLHLRAISKTTSVKVFLTRACPLTASPVFLRTVPPDTRRVACAFPSRSMVIAC